MAIILSTKQGTPIKSLRTALIKPKAAPATKESDVNRFVPIVNKLGLTLSIPEKPTTTNIKQLNSNIPVRHELLYPPILDRGGNRSLPFQGVAKILPNNAIGGKANRIQPVLQTLAKQTKVVSSGIPSRVKADKLQAVIRRSAVIQTQKMKKHTAVIMPGKGGLDIARSPRRFVDAITGKLKMRSAIPILRQKKFGIFAQHRTAPASTVNRLAWVSGQKRESLIEPQLRMLENGSKKDSEVKRPMRVADVDSMTTIAAPLATEDIKQENKNTLERFAFLAVAGVIGYFALRR